MASEQPDQEFDDDPAGFGDVELPPNVSPELYGRVIDVVSFPFKVSVLLIILGVLLLLGGLAGVVDFGFSGQGFNLVAKKASPGLVLVVLGVVLAVLYKPNIRIRATGDPKE